MFQKLELASLWPKKAKRPLAFFEWECLNLEAAVGSQKSPQAVGACPRLDGSTAGALDLARSSDPFR